MQEICVCFKIERERVRKKKLSLFVSPGSGQVCDTNLRVSSFSENPIEDDVRTCIQCVIGGTVSTTTTWLIATTPGGSATTSISSSDGEVVNGVLVIFDPSTIIPGPGNANEIRVTCSVDGTLLNFFIFLDGMFVCFGFNLVLYTLSLSLSFQSFFHLWSVMLPSMKQKNWN